MTIRDDFEAWVKNPHMLHRRTEPGHTDEYEHPWVAGAWSAWQVKHAEAERLLDESEDKFVIDVYRGFQSAIGSGETYLSCHDGLWRVDWEAPRIMGHKRFAGRFEFDASVGIMQIGNAEEFGRYWAKKFRDQLQLAQSSG